MSFSHRPLFKIVRQLALLTFVTLVLMTIARAESSRGKFETPRSAVHIVHSDVLGRDYPIYVRTPRGYDKPANKNKRYPVMYLNDGPYAFQIAAGVTHIPNFSRRYEKVILVGISYAVGEHPKVSRTRDLTPAASTGWTETIGPKTGGAADYLAFLETRLMPFVERTYRVDPERRTLAGHSFGGLFATWVLLKKPQLFESYIISSPSLWVSRRLMFEIEERYAAHHNDLKAKVYFGTGELEKTSWTDLPADQTALVKKLRSRSYPGLKVRERILSDIDHTLAFPINFTRAARWIYQSSRQ